MSEVYETTQIVIVIHAWLRDAQYAQSREVAVADAVAEALEVGESEVRVMEVATLEAYNEATK